MTFENSTLPQCDSIIRIVCNPNGIDELYNVIPHDDYVAFYNLAWRGVNGPEKAIVSVQLDNIKVAAAYADLAKKLKCGRFLCAGTIAEQSVQSLECLNKTSGGMMYGVAKHCAHLILESYCKNIGLPFIWMQFSNIYGVGNKTGNLISYTLTELLAGNNATFGPAEQPYDFIYIDDLIEAVVRLGNCKLCKTFYYIGSGAPRVLKDYLKEIGIICNKENNICIGVRPDDGIKYDYFMFDITPLVQDIGNYVTVPFNEGVKHTISWLETQT